MSKFGLLVWAMSVTLGMGMLGGQVFEKKFPFIVHIISSDIYEGHLGKNGTTRVPNPKWLYCSGVLIDTLTVLTAVGCNVEADGKHWVGAVDVGTNRFHPVKAVIHGRHPLDFEIVKVWNSTMDVWAPLGIYYLFLMITVDEAELNQISLGNETSGIVYSVAKPRKIGAMTVLSRPECEVKYLQLLQKYPGATATLPANLPRTVFCALQAAKPFTPFPAPQRSYRRARRQDTVGDDKNSTAAPAAASMRPKDNLLPPPVAVGAVEPATACPDSLGAPFIIEGGQVLGILVASDCKFLKVAFFQTRVDGLPEDGEVHYSEGTVTSMFLPGVESVTPWKWTPPKPFIDVQTLGTGAIADIIQGRVEPAGALSPAGLILPSTALVCAGLSYASLARSQLLQ